MFGIHCFTAARFFLFSLLLLIVSGLVVPPHPAFADKGAGAAIRKKIGKTDTQIAKTEKTIDKLVVEHRNGSRREARYEIELE